VDQITLGLDALPKKTRKEVFLDEMNRVEPWAELVAPVQPHARGAHQALVRQAAFAASLPRQVHPGRGVEQEVLRVRTGYFEDRSRPVVRTRRRCDAHRSVAGGHVCQPGCCRSFARFWQQQSLGAPWSNDRDQRRIQPVDATH
jgi:hypothetical protein